MGGGARRGVRILGGTVELQRDGKVLIPKDIPGDPDIPARPLLELGHAK